MPAFTKIYEDDQRDAMATAYEDRRVRPAARVVELAAAGELVYEGKPLDAFQANEQSVRHYARELRRRRSGEKTSQLSHAEPRDAMEALRRRLVNMLDGELGVEERKRAGTRDPERIRQIARAMREAAAIPGPKEAAPKKPGAREDGKQQGGQTRGGMAGAILNTHRAQTATTGRGKPAQDAATLPLATTENTGQDATHDMHEAQEHTDNEAPGSAGRVLAASPAGV